MRRRRRRSRRSFSEAELAALASAQTLGAVRQIAEKIVKKLRGDTVRNAGNTEVDA